MESIVASYSNDYHPFQIEIKENDALIRQIGANDWYWIVFKDHIDLQNQINRFKLVMSKQK